MAFPIPKVTEEGGGEKEEWGGGGGGECPLRSSCGASPAIKMQGKTSLLPVTQC